jgi:hypothetical protein
MNFSRLQISVSLGIAAIAWATVLLAQGAKLALSDLAPFSTVVGVLAVGALLMEKLLWRQPWLHGWFVNRPDLRGTWKVQLQSDWINPETGTRIGPITCYMGVEQTLSNLQMHLMTPESESWFVAHSICPSPSETGYQIVGVYTNKPHVHLRSATSAMHLGAVIIDTHGGSSLRPETLTGEYWTDRKTTGRMTLTNRSETIHTQYAQAKQLVH